MSIWSPTELISVSQMQCL